METMESQLRKYFERRDTPMRYSPTGMALIELLKLEPGMDFEAARAAVNAIGASTRPACDAAKAAAKLIQGVKAA